MIHKCISISASTIGQHHRQHVSGRISPSILLKKINFNRQFVTVTSGSHQMIDMQNAVSLVDTQTRGM